MVMYHDYLGGNVKTKTHQTHTFSRVRLRGFRGSTLCPQPMERTQLFQISFQIYVFGVEYTSRKISW